METSTKAGIRIAGILGGPTASGKTDIALKLAEANGWEILSADSRQVYAGLKIGTNQPHDPDLLRVRHHLLGFLPPHLALSPREWAIRARAIIREAQAPLLLVGGSGLYLKELLYPAKADRGETPEAIKEKAGQKLEAEGLEALYQEIQVGDPLAAAKVHRHDRFRIVKIWENLAYTGKSYTEFASLGQLDPAFVGTPFYWLDLERASLHRNINTRVHAMLEQGWLAEVQKLLQENPAVDWPAFTSLGYPQLADYLRGFTSKESAIAEIQARTRRYARRQITYFKHQFPTAHPVNPDALTRALERSSWRLDTLTGPLPLS